jgi:hypothetical protein
MPEKSLAELSRTYLKAYETKDRSALESTMSDDFIFNSPYDDHIDSCHLREGAAGLIARAPRQSIFENYSKRRTKPSFSTTWSSIAENLSATPNFLPEMAARSSLSKSIRIEDRPS